MNNENEVKANLKRVLGKHFFIREEVKGVCIKGQKQFNVRVDFVLTPNQELINLGFPKHYFTIEAKHIIKNSTKKTRHLFIQALNYKDSIFNWNALIKSTPFMSLVYTNLTTIEDNFEKEMLLLNKVNVGTVLIYGNSYAFKLGSRYFLKYYAKYDRFQIGNIQRDLTTYIASEKYNQILES